MGRRSRGQNLGRRLLGGGGAQLLGLTEQPASPPSRDGEGIGGVFASCTPSRSSPVPPETKATTSRERPCLGQRLHRPATVPFSPPSHSPRKPTHLSLSPSFRKVTPHKGSSNAKSSYQAGPGLTAPATPGPPPTRHRQHRRGRAPTATARSVPPRPRRSCSGRRCAGRLGPARALAPKSAFCTQGLRSQRGQGQGPTASVLAPPRTRSVFREGRDADV